MKQVLGQKDYWQKNDSEEMEKIQTHEASKKKIEALEAQMEKIFLTGAEEQQLFIRTTRGQ